jgi:membrane peptidoglycan carboxypeptidase
LTTSTPLQALMMMNDPTVLEASRVLSQKLLEEKSSADEKIRKAFHRIICRLPSEKEMTILTNYFKDQLQQFKLKKLDAAVTIKAGEYKIDDTLDVNMTAALMKVINTIYNMEEAITKS